jgi:hypothetical protein
MEEPVLGRMDDDPEPEPLDGRYLGSISGEFAQVAELVREASYQVRVRHISAFPIFPICKVHQPIGALLLAATEEREWHFYLSYLDEFVQRGIFPEEGIPTFEANYKNADEYVCLFVIDEAFTHLVYIPYPSDEVAEEETSPIVEDTSIEEQPNPETWQGLPE